MKSTLKHVIPLALLLAWPVVETTSAVREDYGWQWPLTLSRDDAGAYRITLDESVYRRVQDPGLRDLVAYDSAGVAVSTAVLEPEQPLARAPRALPLPWFPLSMPQQAASGDWGLVSEADADGRLRRVEVRGGIPDPQALADALVIDLSRVREAVAALELEWTPAEGLDLGYRVEASDDLDHWQPLATRGRLVDLQREGRRLLHRRIELYGLLPHHQRARYLRLTPDRVDQPLEITAVQAVFAPQAVAATVQWIELAPRQVDDEGREFEYRLDGRFPVRQLDVALPGHHAVEWRLESRETPGEPWRARAGAWMTFRIGNGGEASAPRALGGTVRDRHWRLRADAPVQGVPILRLGYRPEVVVFVAQGAPPYALAAGSRRALRADSPLPRLVEALRERHGKSWQPAAAYLGSAGELAGDAALTAPRDWTSWLLWGVLVLGALVVAGFALSLLRPAKPTPQAEPEAEPEADAEAARGQAPDG